LTQSEGGDLRRVVLRWNEVVRPAPEPVLETIRDGTIGLDNLVLSRLLLQVGDTSAALAASRRRWYEPHYLREILSGGLAVDMLREEARLEALTGDSDGAIRTYSHYLALRENPDYAPWRRERDAVRRELIALIGERKR
jgi:hypothetical protein